MNESLFHSIERRLSFQQEEKLGTGLVTTSISETISLLEYRNALD